MNVVIVEDEWPAALQLKKLLAETDAAIKVLQILSSVEEALQWFGGHEAPDLAFMDIELSDGLSLHLIQQARLSCPVIFITAFDDYWQRAFEYNSIDYLLKPLKKERLGAALQKFHELKQYFALRYQNLLAHRGQAPAFKTGFLVKRGKDYRRVEAGDVAFFYATHKLVCLVTASGDKFILDQSLAEIEKELDPALFCRANRKYVVNRKAIQKMTALPKSRLLLQLCPASPDEVMVSAENSNAFKKWIGQK